ncbi:MAG: hypothetical protein ACTSQE_07065 [Candidatus Heimdallarchaeaceae archaeon]
MARNRFIKLCIVFVFLSITIGFYKTSALAQQNTVANLSSTDTVLYLSLYNASYGDFDQDSRIDDIECFLDVQIFTETARATFRLEIYLTTPEGVEYPYSLLVSTSYDSITLQLLFMNHANTPGDYSIRVEANLLTQGHYYDWEDIIFDPPTEQIPDDEPFLTYYVS